MEKIKQLKKQTNNKTQMKKQQPGFGAILAGLKSNMNFMLENPQTWLNSNNSQRKVWQNSSRAM